VRAGFLSYLPSSVDDVPPRGRSPRSERASRGCSRRSRTTCATVQDARDRGAVVDRGSFFEMSASTARALITGFTRLDGWPVGWLGRSVLLRRRVAPIPARRWSAYVDLAQTFHLPIVYLVDCPAS